MRSEHWRKHLRRTSAVHQSWAPYPSYPPKNGVIGLNVVECRSFLIMKDMRVYLLLKIWQEATHAIWPLVHSILPPTSSP